jgi:hypothetical protein
MDLGQEENSVALVASIPIVQVKRGVVDFLENSALEGGVSQSSKPWPSEPQPSASSSNSNSNANSNADFNADFNSNG